MKMVRCQVFGRVQGVWFRGSARDEALKLGLTGHARNLADGSVEVLACGGDDAVDALIRWLHKGPVLARVERVTVEDAHIDAPSGFDVA